MKSAADNITDITLELGGKSPLVVFPDADLEQAVQTTITAIFFNTGESAAVRVHDSLSTKTSKMSSSTNSRRPPKIRPSTIHCWMRLISARR